MKGYLEVENEEWRGRTRILNTKAKSENVYVKKRPILLLNLREITAARQVAVPCSYMLFFCVSSLLATPRNESNSSSFFLVQTKSFAVVNGGRFTNLCTLLENL
ncbi:hypothetical protein ACS0TY_012626 [Phlomoides rotata]